MNNDDAPPSAPSSALALTVSEQQERRATAIAKYNGKIPDECRFYCEACGWDGTLKFDDDELAALGHDPEAYTGPCPGKGAVPATAGDKGSPAVECGFHMLMPYRLVTQGHEALMDASSRQRREDVEMATDVAFDRIAKKVAPFLGGGREQGSVAQPVAAQAAQLPAESRSAALLAIQALATEAAAQVSSPDIATYKNIVIDAAAMHGSIALTAAEVHSIATDIMEATNA